MKEMIEYKPVKDTEGEFPFDILGGWEKWKEIRLCPECDFAQKKEYGKVCPNCGNSNKKLKKGMAKIHRDFFESYEAYIEIFIAPLGKPKEAELVYRGTENYKGAD